MADETQPEQEPEPEQAVAAPPSKLWYVLKVQSNREKSIRDNLVRRIKREGLEEFFGEIIIPTEKVAETKNGKKTVRETKLYPGYLMVHMDLNDETWFLIRETNGVGDFTGAAGKPLPMQDHEVAKLLGREEEKQVGAPVRVKMEFAAGDTVKIKEGMFENFEGSVGSIDEAHGRVTVMIEVFGRSTPTEFEYWQIEKM